MNIDSIIVNSPTLAFLQIWFEGLTYNISNAGKRKGGLGGRGGTGRAINDAKDGLLVFIFFAIMIVTVLVLAGSTSAGSPGIFGNAQVANQWRDSALTLSKFAVIVGLLIIIVIVGALG